MKTREKILASIVVIPLALFGLSQAFIADINDGHYDITYSTKIELHYSTLEGNYATFSVNEKQVQISVEENQLDKIKAAQKESEEICLNIDAYDWKMDYRLSDNQRTYTEYTLKDVWPESSCPPAYKQGERNSGFNL